ncbi:MAG: hypothetical protein IAE97_00770 [Chthoniobacterales bacterium]|nr:hypothetical protein [Chthoniobacterales bacterium]
MTTWLVPWLVLACILASGCTTPREDPPPPRAFQSIADFQMAQLQALGCATPARDSGGSSASRTIETPRQSRSRGRVLSGPPLQTASPQGTSAAPTKASPLTPQPKPQRITPVQKFGNTYFGPGGVTSQRVGGVMINSDGTSGQRIGNTIINY